jgi:hypothetical protein
MRTRNLITVVPAGVVTCVLVVLCLAQNGWAWGNDGHQIVARVAAMNLSVKARRNVAKLLGVSSNPTSVANAMAKAATWPDTFLRNHAPKTKPWHFVDICRGAQVTGGNLDPFCPGGQCITKKIEAYRENIPKKQFDEFGGKGDLSLLIHFVGDIHQPLHCTTNADRGGNCVSVEKVHSDNLHSAWDTDLVKEVEAGSSVEETADQLNEDFQDNPFADKFDWSTGSSVDIALESSDLAEQEIYKPLHIAKQACVVELAKCTEAPAAVQNLDIKLEPDYVDDASAVVRTQLTKAGIRLANLLNSMWP